MNDIITIRGNRDVWLEFALAVKRMKLRQWDVLEPFIKDCIKKNLRQK